MAYWFTIATLSGINVILAYSVYASFMSGQVSIGQAAYFGVAEGELTEDQFNEDLTVKRTRIYKPGELADGDLEQKEIHRVANRGR